MLSRRQYRWVLPAVFLVVLVFLIEIRPQYLGTRAPKWSDFTAFKGQKPINERPPLQSYEEVFEGGSQDVQDEVKQAEATATGKAGDDTDAFPGNDIRPIATLKTVKTTHKISQPTKTHDADLVASSATSNDNPASSTASSHHTGPSSSHSNELLDQAHKLKHADDFLPHFRAVTKLEPVSQSEAQVPCNWDASLPVNFQYGKENEWVQNEKKLSDLAERRAEWHDYVAKGMIAWDNVKDSFEGRGVVILAGNQETFQRLKVTLKMMELQKSKLPVEINYWKDEMDEAKKEEIMNAYHTVYFNDLSSPSQVFKTRAGAYINYNLKTAAVVNSRFAEPLLLDSDNLPVMDPEELYESTTYKEYGTIFWPDIARTRPQNPIWAITNTPCKKDEYEQESGQLLVDKRRFFYHLQLAAWLNDHSYYNEFLLGDKDMFRFAWHALKTAYGRPSRWVTSIGIKFPDGKYCGHSFAQHHPNGSVAFFHGGLLKTLQPSLIRYLTKQTRVFESYKRSDGDEDPTHIEPVEIYYHGAEFAEPKPKYPASCTDMKDVEAKNLDQIAPDFEDLFREAGGLWIADGEDH